jgi:hypothetical protein
MRPRPRFGWLLRPVDRQRRYVLSYERLVNRKIDTFLKVRKASGLGELDLVELEKTIGTHELADLLRASGSTADDEPGDLRSDDGRGRETLAQQHDGRDRETVAQQSDGGDAEGCRPASADVDTTEKTPSVSPSSETACDDDFILRNEAKDVPHDSGGWGRHLQGTPPLLRPPHRGLARRASSTPATHLPLRAHVMTFRNPSETKPATRRTSGET